MNEDSETSTKRYVCYCTTCEEYVVKCGTCNNPTCNGGSGRTEKGEECPDCDDAYKLQKAMSSRFEKAKSLK